MIRYAAAVDFAIAYMEGVLGLEVSAKKSVTICGSRAVSVAAFRVMPNLRVDFAKRGKRLGAGSKGGRTGRTAVLKQRLTGIHAAAQRIRALRVQGVDTNSKVVIVPKKELGYAKTAISLGKLEVGMDVALETVLALFHLPSRRAQGEGRGVR